MAQLVPYLSFTGTCREAMTFYQQCLGGELSITTYGDSPMADQVPAEHRDNVLHAVLLSAEILLMASDLMPGDTVTQGGSVTLALSSGDKEEIRAYFAKLSAGGTVTMPLDEAFFGLYGEATDRFGMRWLFQAGQG
ncbi:MAG TPA: VOC family protein [Thermomicrobiales bacterium]|nr:VOC family protein [Thermomicrobiales bacterium]